ncbi:hypothetical protein M405DRAFT_886336 [Rhizopogon salebrosus TDB-379]|nr:hypothetical protein M405DRAFT_886336 [Rhizopogon salebrosus TDB-379]
MSHSASIAREAADHGLDVTSGAFEAIGGLVLANTCSPCIGQWAGKTLRRARSTQDQYPVSLGALTTHLGDEDFSGGSLDALVFARAANHLVNHFQVVQEFSCKNEKYVVVTILIQDYTVYKAQYWFLIRLASSVFNLVQDAVAPQALSLYRVRN